MFPFLKQHGNTNGLFLRSG